MDLTDLFLTCAPRLFSRKNTWYNPKNWLWIDSSFAPTALLLHPDMEAALWPLVCTWITACDLWWREVFKSNKGGSFPQNVRWWQTNIHTTVQAPACPEECSSFHPRAPLLHCVLSLTHTHTGECIISVSTTPFQGPLPQRPEWQGGKHGLVLPKQLLSICQSLLHELRFPALRNTGIFKYEASVYITQYVCLRVNVWLYECVLMCHRMSATVHACEHFFKNAHKCMPAEH